MNVVFTIDYTGVADADDVLAARQIVFLENQRLAALTPPGTPLPTAPPASLKASYLSVLLTIVTNAHLSYIAQTKSDVGYVARFTLAERTQIAANLVTRLNNGESSASIVTDTVS
jgi:hypothetical protein